MKGANIHIHDLYLDGALIVNAIDQAEVKLSPHIQNDGRIITGKESHVL